jgi:hypothetical protein
MKRTQWFNYDDHPYVRRPKEHHLQPVFGVKNCGVLSTPEGDVLIREGDWIVTDENGAHHLERSA